MANLLHATELHMSAYNLNSSAVELAKDRAQVVAELSVWGFRKPTNADGTYVALPASL